MNVKVFVITFDNPFMARAYVKATGLPWPLLLDQGRQLYRDYELLTGSWRDIYGLRSILRYLREIASGAWPGRPGKDWHQLGGDVVIDPQGIVRGYFRSVNPHDRPKPARLIQLIQTPAH